MVNNNIQTWDNYTTPNYPLLFITRWIPFNAWYVSVTGKTTDRDCILYFKGNTNNKLYDRIKKLMDSANKEYECVAFQHELARMEGLLKNKDFPSQQQPICFGVVEMAPNDKREERKVIDHYAYTVKRYKEGDGSGKPNKSVEVIIENLAPPKNTETITLLKHDVQELEEKMKSKKWKSSQKKNVLEVFKSIEPIIHLDVKDTKAGCLKIGVGKFCKDKDAICASVIDVLYELRCKAVHGEIEINRNTLTVYECAFQMLKLITQKFY